MIKLYVSKSSTSSRRAKTWLINNHLPFEEISLNKISDLSKQELIHILSLTNSGTTDIISKKSRAYQRLNINFDKLTLNELFDLLNEHRSLLRRPLIVDEKRLQVGFNAAEIRQFIPHQIRVTQKEQLDLQLRQIYDTKEC